MKILNKTLFLLLLITILVSGCSIFPDNYSPTSWPTNYLSTAIFLTMEAFPPTAPVKPFVETLVITTSEFLESTPIGETQINDVQPSATPSQNNQRTPTLTPTPKYPEAFIQIISPGSLSKVISPIKIEAYAQPGAENRVFIELIGETGQVITSEIRDYQNLSRLWAPVNQEISFQIESAAEFARLQIHTQDQFHRIISLSSIHLILQSDGINKLYTNSILYDRCIIHSPRINEVIAGGVLNVNGEFLPFNDQPILIELIAESGFVINSKSIQLQPGLIDHFLEFIIDIPYQVDTRTPVRLTISQKDERIPGYMYVYSQLISVEP